jgi:hypothetical protein
MPSRATEVGERIASSAGAGCGTIRTAELSLIIADVLAFAVLAFPLSGRVLWLRRASSLALLVTGLLLLIEGPRWPDGARRCPDRPPPRRLAGASHRARCRACETTRRQPACRRPGCRVGCPVADGLNRNAAGAPRVHVSDSNRAIRDRHIHLPLGRCRSAGRGAPAELRRPGRQRRGPGRRMARCTLGFGRGTPGCDRGAARGRGGRAKRASCTRMQGRFGTVCPPCLFVDPPGFAVSEALPPTARTLHAVHWSHWRMPTRST